MKIQDKEVPTLFQRKICWAALTGVALVVVVSLVFGLLFGLGSLFVALEPVLLPVVIAGFLAYLLSPCVALVQKRITRRIWAVVSVMSIACVLLVGLGLTIVPPLVQQTGDLISKREQILESVVEGGKAQLAENRLLQKGVDMLYSKMLKDARASELPLEDYEDLSQETTYEGKLTAILSFNSSYLTEKVLGWLTAGTRALSGVSMAFIGTIMVPVFLFYFLLESASIARNWHTVLPIRRSAFREEVVETLQEINNYIISFVRGQMLVSVIDGIILAVALKIMGLPYAVTIAAAAALLGIIPYLGMISTWIPAVLIAWFTWHDVSHVLIVTAIFGCVSQFDGWVLQPRIVGSRVKMHDLTVMFSVLFWSYVIGGVVGALLAVPLTASIKVIFTRYIWSSYRSAGEQK
ncbi:MAG: AI-2E family transporter [Akkermansiaceae bacterium]|nr:AI-2E family transporter [Akkermansiaceae bacterium]